MGMMTSEELSRFFQQGPVNSLRIEGIKLTEDSRYLGAIGLSLRHPLFNSILGFNFSGVLSDSARFLVVPVSAAVEGKDGLVAVFRQFDASQYQSTPEELLAGWVPPDDAARLEGWVADMNQQLKGLLQLKHQTPS